MNVMDGGDLNAMTGGMNCASKALRGIAECGTPRIGLWAS